MPNLCYGILYVYSIHMQQHKMMNIVCNHCQTNFELPVAQFNRRKKENPEVQNFYCSQNCWKSYCRKKSYPEIECTQCKQKFNKAISEIKKSNKHFCSRSCNARYHNQFRKKPRDITKTRKYQQDKILNTTLEEFCKNYKGPVKYSQVRDMARKVMKLEPKICQNCGYDKHVEICHIKAVATFPPTALVKEVNDKTNLLILCPNCHWEFDKGYIKLPFKT